MGKKSKRQRQKTSKGKGSSVSGNGAEVRTGTIRDTAKETFDANIIGSNPRSVADRLKEDFLSLTSDESENCSAMRISRIQQYVKVLWEAMEEAEDYNAVNILTKEDKKFIKSVSKNSDELAIIRASATTLWARYSNYNLDHESAAQSIYRAIEICQEPSEGEKQQIIVNGRTMGELLNQSLHHLQYFLEIVRGKEGHLCYSERKDLAYESIPFIGGDQCNVCDKTHKDLGVDMLDCCQLCQLTYYCCQECQWKDWKEHKKVCRKRGEFKVGDCASFAGHLPEIGVHFGAIVRIWLPAPDDPDPRNPKSWLVVREANNQTCTVLSKDLRRCRPALWNKMDDKCLLQAIDDAKEVANKKAAEKLLRESLYTIALAEVDAKHLSPNKAAKLLQSDKVKEAARIRDSLGHHNPFVASHLEAKGEGSLVPKLAKTEVAFLEGSMVAKIVKTVVALLVCLVTGLYWVLQLFLAFLAFLPILWRSIGCKKKAKKM